MPKNVREDLNGPFLEEWIKKMEYKMKSMRKNDFWTLIGKWVLKMKLKIDVTLKHYKARLVAKGYT